MNRLRVGLEWNLLDALAPGLRTGFQHFLFLRFVVLCPVQFVGFHIRKHHQLTYPVISIGTPLRAISGSQAALAAQFALSAMADHGWRFGLAELNEHATNMLSSEVALSNGCTNMLSSAVAVQWLCFFWGVSLNSLFRSDVYNLSVCVA